MISGFNISPQQSRIWSLQKDGSTRYVSGSVLIDGDIDTGVLEDRLKTLVARQSILRTSYFSRPEVIYPLQVIMEQGDYHFVVSDLSALEEADQQKAIADWEKCPFPDTKAYEAIIPLQVHLFRLHAEQWLLGIGLAAMAADVCSLLQVAGFLCGNEAQQTDIIQYVQFSEWQHNLLKKTVADAEVFWQERTREIHIQGPLPFRRQAGPEWTVGTESTAIALDAALTGQLFARQAETGMDAATMFLTCLALLLHRQQGMQQIVIGNIVANRRYEQLQPTLGPLAKMVPLIINVGPQESFTALWQDTKAAVDNAAQWTEYFSYNYLSSLQPGDTPLVLPAGFEYIDASAAVGENCTVRNIINQGEQFRIKFTVTRYRDNYTVACSFDTACFTAEDAAVLLDQFHMMLRATASRPDQPLHRYSALSDTAAARLTNSFNPVPVTYPREGIVQLFRRQVKRTPDNIALEYGEHALSYVVLDELSDNIAQHLISHLDLGRGDRAMILMDNSHLSVAAIIAVLKTGAAYLPADARDPLARLQYIVETASPAVIIAEDASLLQQLGDSATGKFLLDSAFAPSPHKAAPLPDDNDLSAIAYVIHTSGSSGKPKGVKITQGNLINYICWANQYYFGNEGGKPFALFTALTFDLTVTSIFTTLLRGDKIIVYPAAADIAAVLTAVFRKETGVAAVKLTPSHVSMLKMLDVKTTGVQLAILGGEALNQGHVEILRALNPQMRIFNEYGPTECTVGCTVAELPFGKGAVTIGRAVANTKIFIMNDALELLAEGEAGEICVAGAGVFPGYLQETAEQKIVTSPLAPDGRLYRTGDMGLWLPGGELVYLGRKDDQIKIRGYRIEPGEIEKALLAVAGVKEAAVIAEGDDPAAKHLTAFVVADSIPDETTLRTALAKELPPYMIPSFFVFPDELPLSSHGKTDYKKLLEISARRYATKAVFVAPATDTEHKLLELWKEVLQSETISVRDNFFMIGGHSIKALQIISRISREFQVEASLAGMFADPTIEGMGRLVDRLQGITFTPIRQLEEQPTYEVSYAQRRLWVSDKAAANKTVYNMPGVFLFEGHLDREAFADAVSAVVERHEGLRTTFVSVDGQPRQVVHPADPARYPVACVEIEESSLEGLIQAEVNAPFDLTEGPLFRIKIFRVNETKSVVVSTTHHIISDAWSIGIMIREITELYNAFSQRKELTLPPLRVQYKDFAAWQNSRLDNEPEHAAYWKHKLTQLPPVLSLPADFPRPAVRSLRGRKVSGVIDAATTAGVTQLGKEQGVSLFTVLFSGLYSLLQRITQQQDIVIGTSVAGRDHIDLEQQIGIFVNLLAIRTSFANDGTFTDLLKQVNSNLLEAFSHQLYPFDRIVEDLQLPRNTSRSPVFDVLLVLQNTAIADDYAVLSGLSVNNVDVNIEKSEFDLVLNVIPTGENLSVVAHYNTDIFEEATIFILLEKWKRVFRTICANPLVPLKDIVVQLDEEIKLKENTTNLEFNFN